MPQACDYNCATLPAHEQVDCGEYLTGGYNAVAVVECDHTISDWSNEAEWAANIASGKVHIIGPVRASIPEPSPVEGVNPNSCGNDTILDTFDRTAIWTDYNVTSGNIAMYNSLNRRNTFLVLYNCKNDDVTVMTESLGSFVVGGMGPESKKEKRMFTATFKYVAFDAPQIYDAPAGIFNF